MSSNTEIGLSNSGLQITNQFLYMYVLNKKKHLTFSLTINNQIVPKYNY